MIRRQSDFTTPRLPGLCATGVAERKGGVCDPRADIRWLQRELAKLRDNPNTKQVLGWTEELQRRNSGLTGAALEHGTNIY